LTKLSKAVAKVKKSKEANFFDLKTIFVSVDPDRDTPEKISKFIKLFDPEMIGVTGKANQD
jgi:cytochrome oxidase Cu insertion factor (SCO1/SenC/PrrC family)